MIDFRYHIVSLISVFLALAVGIVLGAGPLRDYIADELTGQVDQLRAEKDALRADLDTAELQLDHQSSYNTEVAPQLLDGTLAARTVAIVELPGADQDVVTALINRLEQSGAAVTARVAVTQTWTDPGQRPFRSGIAGNLLAYLNPAPADDAGVEATLGAALGQALTLRDVTDTGVRSADAAAMYELLLSSELISEVTAPTGPAYATVVIAPRTPGEDADVTDLNVSYIELAEALAGTGEGSVLVGTDTAANDLVATVRGDETAAGVVSTVDGVNTVIGQVTTPLALAAAIGGTVGHYGFAEGASAVLPAPTALPAPTPAAFAPLSEEEAAQADAEAAAQG